MKLALISGGSKGLGAALCQRHRAQGWQVLELSRSGQGDGHFDADFSDPHTWIDALEARLYRFSSEPIEAIRLINNAAMIDPIAPVGKLSSDAIERSLTVNLSATIMLCNAFTTAFQDLAADKTIVNISSGAAKRSIRSWSLYCAAKAGLEHFGETLAAEQAQSAHPIANINIDPGVMDTEMQHSIRGVDASLFPDLAFFQQRKADGELRSADVVACAVMDILDTEPASGSRHSVAEFLAQPPAN